MEQEYVHISRDMLTEEIVGKKVIASDRGEEDNPPTGLVVACNGTRGTVWVTWNPMVDPERLHASALLLVKVAPMKLDKEMRFAGKTLGSLEKFVEQAYVEGADYNTILNPGKFEHVAFMVRLPLATKSDKPLPTALDLVDGRKPGMD